MLCMCCIWAGYDISYFNSLRLAASLKKIFRRRRKLVEDNISRGKTITMVVLGLASSFECPALS